jgi:multidrug transporter EmrE-like cation transporter
MHLIKGILYGLLAQIITFLQLQGQIKIEWIKNNLWFAALLGAPVSILFMLSVRHLIEAYDGQIWPSRLIGFGIGVVVFTIMSYWLFKEPINPKTFICLGLAVLIILVQIFWK